MTKKNYNYCIFCGQRCFKVICLHCGKMQIDIKTLLPLDEPFLEDHEIPKVKEYPNSKECGYCKQLKPIKDFNFDEDRDCYYEFCKRCSCKANRIDQYNEMEIYNYE